MKTKWIRVTEQMPNLLEDVLVAIKWQNIPVQAYWNGEKWRGSIEVTGAMKEGFVENRDICCPQYIIYWTPLPEVPNWADEI